MSHPFTTCSSHDVVMPKADDSVGNSAETANVSPNALVDTAVYVEAFPRFTGLDALPSAMIHGLEFVVTFQPSTKRLFPMAVLWYNSSFVQHKNKY